MSIGEADGAAKRVVATQGIETNNIEGLLRVHSSFATVKFVVYFG
jgi:hypothetical protein